MAVVVFDVTAFRARYPEFASVADATLAAYFDEACIYLSNTDRSPVCNVTRRALLLNMLVAHVAFINGRPVGRLSNATEGSVSSAFEYLQPGTHAWYTQSQYGAAFWQATASLRGFRYFPRPTQW